MPTQEQLDAAKAALDERDEALQGRQKAVDELLAGTPSALELREEENYWRTKQKETGELRNQLLAWANAAQAGVQQLQAEQPVWNETLQQNQSTPDLGPTLDVIKKSVSDLQQVTKQAQDQLRVIVNLQIRAASQDQMAIDALDRLQKAREYVDSRIFERDSLPLWERGPAATDGRKQRSFSIGHQSADGNSRLRGPNRRRDCFSVHLARVLPVRCLPPQPEDEGPGSGERGAGRRLAYRAPLDRAGRIAAAAVCLSAGSPCPVLAGRAGDSGVIRSDPHSAATSHSSAFPYAAVLHCGGLYVQCGCRLDFVFAYAQARDAVSGERPGVCAVRVSGSSRTGSRKASAAGCMASHLRHSERR